MHLWYVFSTVTGNKILYRPIVQCHSCACHPPVWPQCETHFSTNLPLVALPSPLRYSSIFTSSCTAQSIPPPTARTHALPLNNTPHSFEHPSASTAHSQSQSPAFRRQQNQTNSHKGFLLQSAQSREQQLLDHIYFNRRTSRFLARAQGHSGWQVNIFLLMHRQSEGSTRPQDRFDICWQGISSLISSTATFCKWLYGITIHKQVRHQSDYYSFNI